MRSLLQAVRYGLALCLLSAVAAYGDIISLVAWVSTSLFKNDGVTPLPYGSIVMIFGSTDDVNDGIPLFGSGPCFLGPQYTQGDDVYLGMVRIGQPYYYDEDDNPVPGTFLSDMKITWNTEEYEINYLYIRFFNTLSFTGGQVEWGYSSVFPVNISFFVATQDFIGGYLANLTNCFVSIPEPGTVQLMLIGGLMIGLLAAVKRPGRSVKPRRKVSCVSCPGAERLGRDFSA